MFAVAKVAQTSRRRSTLVRRRLRAIRRAGGSGRGSGCPVRLGSSAPGSGALDLPGLVDELAALGGLSSVDPEVFSPTSWALPPEGQEPPPATRSRGLFAGR